MKTLKNKKGFTLIEIIVALAILGVMAVAFFSMFTSGFLFIHSAGDKGEAFSEAQSGLEGEFASGSGEVDDRLELEFDGREFIIPGEDVAAEGQGRTRDSALGGFAPFVPTITLNPRVQNEGKNPMVVEVTGENTNFNGDTKLKIYDVNGNTYQKFDNSGALQDSVALSVVSQTRISLSFPSGLVNAHGDYIIELYKDGIPEETVRGKLVIAHPLYIAAGDGKFFTSGNSTYWMDRTIIQNSVVTGFSGFTMKGSAYGQGQFVIGGENGKVLVNEYKRPWKEIDLSGVSTVNGVAWSGEAQRFFIADDEGNIRYSEDPYNDSWSLSTVPNSDDLVFTDITANFNGEIFAVGYRGEINVDSGAGEIYKADNTSGGSWSNVETTGERLLGATSYIDASGNSRFVVVGENGWLMTSTNGNSWTKRDTNTNKDIRDVVYSRGRLAAVGENVILSSTDNGGTWSKMENSSWDLYGVEGSVGEFIAVGADGLTLQSTGLGSWVSVGSVSGVTLYSVTGSR